jgi:hypothetical protein
MYPNKFSKLIISSLNRHNFMTPVEFFLPECIKISFLKIMFQLRSPDFRRNLLRSFIDEIQF